MSTGNNDALSRNYIMEPCYLVKIFVFPDLPGQPLENPEALQASCDYRVLLDFNDKSTLGQIKERTKEILGKLYPFLFPYLFKIMDKVCFQTIHKGGPCLLHDSVYLSCLKHEEYDLYMTLGIPNFNHYMFLHLPEWKKIREQVNGREEEASENALSDAQDAPNELSQNHHTYPMSPASSFPTSPASANTMVDVSSFTDNSHLKDITDSEHHEKPSEDSASSAVDASASDYSSYNSSSDEEEESEEEEKELHHSIQTSHIESIDENEIGSLKLLSSDNKLRSFKTNLEINNSESNEDGEDSVSEQSQEEEDDDDEEEEEEEEEGEEEEEEEEENDMEEEADAESDDDEVELQKAVNVIPTKDDSYKNLVDSESDEDEYEEDEEDDEDDELPPFPCVKSTSNTDSDGELSTSSTHPITLNDVVPSIKFASPEVYALTLNSTTPTRSSKPSKTFAPPLSPSPKPPLLQTAPLKSQTVVNIIPSLSPASKGEKTSSKVLETCTFNPASFSPSQALVDSNASAQHAAFTSFQAETLKKNALVKQSLQAPPLAVPDIIKSSKTTKPDVESTVTTDVSMTSPSSSDDSESDSSYSSSSEEESSLDEVDDDIAAAVKSSSSSSACDTSSQDSCSEDASSDSESCPASPPLTPSNAPATLPVLSSDAVSKRKSSMETPVSTVAASMKKTKLETTPLPNALELKVMKGTSPSLKAMISSGAFHRLKHLPTFTVPDSVMLPHSVSPTPKTGNGGTPGLSDEGFHASDADASSSESSDSDGSSDSDTTDSEDSCVSTVALSDASETRIQYARSSKSSQRSRKSFLSSLSQN